MPKLTVLGMKRYPILIGPAALLAACPVLQAMDGPTPKVEAMPSSSSAPGPASVNFRAYVLEAMDRIEAARRNGVLMYPEDYVKKHAEVALSPGETVLLSYGRTTHSDLFEQYAARRNPLLVFRLKPMVSASEALDALLERGETVLDCGAVTGLAYQVAARMAFEARYGKEKGRLRFDYLWGSARFEVPKVQRLLVTNNGMMAGTEHYRYAVDGNVNPLNPFSFFVGFAPLAMEAARARPRNLAPLKRELKVGSLVNFVGHPEFYDKHPASPEGGYNLVVAHNGPGGLKFRFFGDEGQTWDEPRLAQRHVDVYNRPVDAVNALAQATMAGVEAGFPDRITPEDVPGLDLTGNVDLKEAPWALLLEGAMAEVLPRYRSYLNQQLMGRRGLLPEDAPMLETVANRRIYWVAPEALAKDAFERIAACQGRLVSKHQGHAQVELPSGALTRETREALGLERRAIRDLSTRSRELLSQHPEIILEPDLLENRTLVTLPVASLPVLEAILAGTPKA